MTLWSCSNSSLITKKKPIIDHYKKKKTRKVKSVSMKNHMEIRIDTKVNLYELLNNIISETSRKVNANALYNNI